MKTLRFLLPVFLFSLLCACGAKQAPLWSVRMTDSEIARNPESWMLDFSPKLKWNYCPGLETYAIYEVYKATGNKKYFDYVKSFADTMVYDNGNAIRTYDPSKFNIDNIAGGKTMLAMYAETGDVKYKNAANLLRNQMREHPRTSEGGFWHKQIYPHQMWLDGLYMASPFLAKYGKEMNEPELFDEVANQLTLVAKYTHDPKTGLYYHGWDESRNQRWSNPQTGTSPNFWTRSIGWYMMALVDVLEYLPADHPRQPEIVKILQDLSASLEKYRDPKTGVFYQVTDQVGRDSNYLESSGTCMIMYTWAKGANYGWLDTSYLQKANGLFDNIVTRFIKENPDGTISLTDGCSVAGLGGSKPGEYRDGTYAYYVGEPIRDNDPKAVGPFIYGALQLKR